ncbi:DUF3927 family protein [Aeromonas veronii]|uniref:DUF3927 family protein n=1 Tax=Aeromonas veronii TaxID=654 RepID=UPI001957564B|nr:DUF3927 family protein [Aeromonas veronii]
MKAWFYKNGAYAFMGLSVFVDFANQLMSTLADGLLIAAAACLMRASALKKTES